jgi:outer membrane immunogenic protein
MKKYFALAAALAFVPGAAMAQDSDAKLDGVRAEARIGYETPTVSDSGSIYKIGSAVSYGGEIGFDAKLGKSVQAGPYAVYEFSSVSLCSGGACLNEQGNLGAGLRLGFVASSKVVVYAKAGYARISFKASAGGLSATDSKDGVQGALGVDVNLSKHVYLMAELNYADYGKFAGVNLARRHVAAGVGFRF